MLSPFLSSEFTDALGWTLLHSLWQGALIAILMALVFLFLNRRSAQVRYFVATSALVALLVAAVVTFSKHYSSKEMPATNVPALLTDRVVTDASPENSIAANTQPPVSGQEMLSHWLSYAETHAPLIVMLWLAGILVLTLRFMGSLLYVQRLKHYKTQAVPEEWQQKVRLLSQQIGLRQTVQLAQSALVKVPMAIGYFKPVILLPVGTFTGLSPQQVEALLAHELAHIVRNDYWINILQSVIEILFFFHPAVWWISGIVRQEREHCCDDMAVQLSGDSLTFAYALASLPSLQPVPQLALGANGGKGSLLYRIQRLLGQSPQKPTFNEGLLASGVLVLCLLVTSVYAFANLKAPEIIAENSISHNSQTPPSDSLSGKTTYYGTYTDTSKVVREIIIVKDRKGNVTDVLIDGRKLTREERKNYQRVIDQKLHKTSVTGDRPKNQLEDEEESDGLFLAPPLAPMPPPPMEPADPMEPTAPLPPMAPTLPPMPPLTGLDNHWSAEVNRISDQIAKQADQLAGLYEKGAYDEGKGAAIQQKMNELVRQMQDLNQKQQENLQQWQTEAGKEHTVELQRYQQAIKQYQKEVISQVKEHRIKSQQLSDKNQSVARNQQERQHQAHERAIAEHAKALKEHEKATARHEKLAEKHQRFMKLLVAELKKDGLIQNENRYSLKLTRHKLVVNGKEQPAQVFKRYKDLIKKETGEDIEKWTENQTMQINHQVTDDNNE